MYENKASSCRLRLLPIGTVYLEVGFILLGELLFDDGCTQCFATDKVPAQDASKNCQAAWPANEPLVRFFS